MSGVPVKIDLQGHTFRALERMAERNDVTVREYIATHLDRAVARAEGRTYVPRTPVDADGKRRYVRVDDEQRAHALKLYRAGWTIKDLAARFGCTPGTMSANLTKAKAAENG